MNKNKLNILLFGAPGSGKGTQAVKLVETYGLHIIAASSILAATAHSDDEEGRKIISCMRHGRLVDDETVCRLMQNELQKISNTKGFLFDGFPRNIKQARALTEMLEKFDMQLDVIIELRVSSEDLEKRLGQRLVCRNCGHVFSSQHADIDHLLCKQCNSHSLMRRPDDIDAKIAKERIQKYKENISGIRQYYGSQLCEVDGGLSVDQVAEEIKIEIGKKLKKFD